MAFRPSGRQRQDGIASIEGLNGRLLLEAKHGNVLRRRQVQADDFGRLFFEVGIVDRR
jgi:hypothetical protein